MASKEEISSFIRATFRSVWSLELLVFLSDNRKRSWTQEELVSSLRGSDLVVSQSLESLVAAGLVCLEANGTARFSPASRDLEQLTGETKARYAKTPDAVRRMIITTANGDLAAFANAFKLRRE